MRVTQDGYKRLAEILKKGPIPWKYLGLFVMYICGDPQPAHSRICDLPPPPALIMFEVMEAFSLKQVAHHATRAHIGLCALSH
jgi:hypothetical protein